jgi:hypothetical protein
MEHEKRRGVILKEIENKNREIIILDNIQTYLERTRGLTQIRDYYRMQINELDRLQLLQRESLCNDQVESEKNPQSTFYEETCDSDFSDTESVNGSPIDQLEYQSYDENSDRASEIEVPAKLSIRRKKPKKENRLTKTISDELMKKFTEQGGHFSRKVMNDLMRKYNLERRQLANWAHYRGLKLTIS